MKFKKGDVVVIKSNPDLGFIAIEKIFDDWKIFKYSIQLYNGNCYAEDELISRKEYEYNRDFESIINDDERI